MMFRDWARLPQVKGLLTWAQSIELVLSPDTKNNTRQDLGICMAVDTTN
jgi:hypothetical protein